MARALRIQFPGAFYHITCRGIEQRSIYVDDRDRLRFLELLTRSLDTYQVAMHAFIMMDNHFHLLIQTRKANCSEFMRHFNISYTAWFNWRYSRRGNLYQGRYNACLIDADRYLLEVSRYIHLNIVRVKRWQSSHHGERWRAAGRYKWSSLAGYLDQKSAKEYVHYSMLLDMIGGRRAYGRYMIDGLKRGVADPFKKVQRRMILGSDDFAAEVEHHLQHGSLRDQPAYREFVMQVLKPEELLKFLAQECGITDHVLRMRQAHGPTRGLVAELLYKYCNITQSQIGKLLGGIDYGAVHLLRRRVREKMRKNAELKKLYDDLDARIGGLL